MGNRVTHIQIKLKDYSKAALVQAELRKLFPDDYAYQINTWEQKQNSLLQAVDIERGLLNLLLFMIVGVAGFCILAIFSTIVREKTRDIGILKSLGASNRGVMQIFLGYGLLLGLIGAGLGTALGLVDHVQDQPDRALPVQADRRRLRSGCLLLRCDSDEGRAADRVSGQRRRGRDRGRLQRLAGLPRRLAAAGAGAAV